MTKTIGARCRTDLKGRGPLLDDLGMAVADDLAAVSQILVAARGVEATVALVCALAVDHIPGCETADVLMLSGKRIRSVGATSDAARTLSGCQIKQSQGPCIDALEKEDVVRVDDLSTDSRWPSFGPAAAAATGIRSVLAYGVRVNDWTMGALNLYSTSTKAFDDGSATSHLGALFASHAAVALAGAHVVDGLSSALETRESISMAMGILMGRQRISKVQAFDILRRASQRENIKLRDIAARIVAGAESVCRSE